MDVFQNRLLDSVIEAGHWGVLRNGLVSPECFRQMACMVGMSTSGGFVFRNEYFADGVKELNPKAATALCLFFGINRNDVDRVSNILTGQQTITTD